MAQVRLLKITSGVFTQSSQTDSIQMYSIGLGVSPNTIDGYSLSIQNSNIPTTLGTGVVIYSSSGVFSVKQSDGSIVGGFLAGGDLSGSATNQTLVSISGSNPIQIAPSNLQYKNTTSNPKINQADQTSSLINGQSLTVQAQNATGATSTGGALNLSSGSGTTSAGNINLQVGGVNIATVDSNKFTTNIRN